MSNSDETNDQPEEVDTDQDENIDKKESPILDSANEMRLYSSYEPATTRPYRNDYTTSQYGENTYKANYTYASGCMDDRYALYGTTIVAGDYRHNNAIHTSSPEETNDFIQRTPNIYKDPNPQITQRTRECTIRQEQRVTLQCLQPPVLPGGKLIIKQVRSPPPPPLPPFVIEEEPPALSPPPLILRERPPTLPPPPPDETKICYLPPSPPPPRTVIVNRYPAPPEKPREIIIERWLPYQHGGRHVVVEPPPPPPSDPEQHNRIIVFQGCRPVICRRFQYLGVRQEDPNTYVATHRSSLLDAATLVQRARDAGVTEDICCTARSYSTYTDTGRNTVDCDWLRQTASRGFSSSAGITCDEILRNAGTGTYRVGNTYYSSSADINCDEILRNSGTGTFRVGNTNYSSSSGNLIRNSTLTGNASRIQGDYYVGDAGLTATDTYYD